jgi:hypothetical protein
MGAYFRAGYFTSGCPFWISVIGAAALSSRVLMRKRVVLFPQTFH